MASRQQGGTGHQIEGYNSTRSREPSEIGGDSPEKNVRHFKSSAKVHDLTAEIKELENRAIWLEARNQKLSESLMKMQATTVSQSMGNDKKQMRVRVFKAWVEASGEIKLERHLEEQTKALEECKRVAMDLGKALKHEQELRMVAEDAANQLKEQLGSGHASNDAVRNKIEIQLSKKALLQKRLKTVEEHVELKRGHARAVVSEGDRYESRRRDLEKQHNRGEEKQQHLYSVVDSQHLRDEARETMQQVRELLPPAPRVTSPTSPPRPIMVAPPPATVVYASPPQSLTIPPGQASRSRVASRADQALSRFQDFQQRHPEPPRRTVQEIADELFTKIDTDGDGAITRDEFDRAQREGLLQREELVRSVAMQQPQLQLPVPQRRMVNDRLGSWQASDGMEGSPIIGGLQTAHTAPTMGGLQPGGNMPASQPSFGTQVGSFTQQQPITVSSGPLHAGGFQPGSPVAAAPSRIFQAATSGTGGYSPQVGYGAPPEPWWSRSGQPTVIASQGVTHKM
jgi:hypothetical protein